MMLYENNFYRTSDGLLDIEFLFVDLGRTIGWRAYILTDINYRMFSIFRSTCCFDIHRLSEGDKDLKLKINNFIQATRCTDTVKKTIYYICWSQPIHDLSDMREIAKTWSEITAYYIRNGGSFSSIQKKLKQRKIISL